MLDRPRPPAGLFRQWIWLVVPPTTLALIGFLVSDAQPRRYEATAALVYQPTSDERPLDAARTNEFVERNIKTEERLLNSPTSQREFKARFGEHVVIGADAVEGADVIEITVEASSPEAAAGIADAVVEDHIERRRADVREELTGATARLAAAVDDLEQRRDGLDAEVAAARTALRRLETEIALTDGDVRAAGPAVPPTSPTSPEPVRSAGQGAMLGIVVGLGLALLRKKGHRRLDSTTDVLAREPLFPAAKAGRPVPGLDVMAHGEWLMVADSADRTILIIEAGRSTEPEDRMRISDVSHPAGPRSSEDEPGPDPDVTASTGGRPEGPRSAVEPHPVRVGSPPPGLLIENAQPAIDRRSYRTCRATPGDDESGDVSPRRLTGTGQWWATHSHGP